MSSKLCPPFVPMREIYHNLRRRTLGGAVIAGRVITPEQAQRSRVIAEVTGQIGHHFIEAGKYVNLSVSAELVMSDTLYERRTHSVFVRHARGDVLIAGLGLGMCLVPVLLNPLVKRVIVVEKSRDVIDLVTPYLEDYFRGRQARAWRKIHIVEADIFEWQPPWSFDAVWFDIWTNIGTENLPQMAKLHRRYGRWYLNPGGWMGSWAEAACRRMARVDKVWQGETAIVNLFLGQDRPEVLRRLMRNADWLKQIALLL